MFGLINFAISKTISFFDFSDDESTQTVISNDATDISVQGISQSNSTDSFLCVTEFDDSAFDFNDNFDSFS